MTEQKQDVILIRHSPYVYIFGPKNALSFRPAFIREQGAKFAALGEERERDEKDEFVIKSARENQVWMSGFAKYRIRHNQGSHIIIPLRSR